ncbi:hypothetical protein TVAG_233040 [Trichomonas vaginalis G3]|uniref:Zinc finger Sec23/Sec24-type domain-containing protein n=1 Tax=Trichomonas vaginalis (strain ATCC PRA-98 / G3) TaxID=412133 RepID=A2ERX3_TRIV3|nr:SEC24-related protein family [Trichomonas vaginalis G3]EAY04568.1 hypothetical protein TVAG_233040 [Trichomonas vaginalis G3]KAI5516067.1 SEC24-related protein family [Trichomonas vaginalis G3]|eukprot:XP_001316791.1 hypothetical protein [Trichomonas vaginalis G3]
MQATTGFLPLTEEIKKKTPIPLGVAISPTTPGIAAEIDATVEQLIRCSACQGYLSPFCKIENGKWECSICHTQHLYEESEISKAQLANSNYQVNIRKNPEMGQFICIYFSTDFNESDFNRNKQALTGLLRYLPKDARCIIFIGSEQYPIALLVPPQKFECFSLNSENTDDQIAPDAYSVTTTEPNKENTELHVACIAKFSSFNAILGLDLAKFFFTQETIPAAERALAKISRSKDKTPVIKSIELAGTLANAFTPSPLRFISFVDQIPRTPPILEALRKFLVRLDYVVTNYTKCIPDMAKVLQGEIYILSNENPGGQGMNIARSTSAYQLVSRCRGHRCATEWKQAPNHLSEVQEQVIFLPVLISDNQPLALEIVPLPNQPSYVFQLTAKYYISEPDNTAFIFRVMNFEIKSTGKLQEYVSSVNWNVALWFWMHKVFEKYQREAVSALMRGAANVIAEVGDVSEDLKRAVCSTRHLYALGSDPIMKYIGGQLMFTTVPESLNIVPKIIVNNGKKIVLSANGVYEDSPDGTSFSEEAIAYQSKYPIYLPIITPIDKNLAEIDQEYLGILDKLVRSLQN